MTTHLLTAPKKFYPKRVEIWHLFMNKFLATVLDLNVFYIVWGFNQFKSILIWFVWNKGAHLNCGIRALCTHLWRLIRFGCLVLSESKFKIDMKFMRVPQMLTYKRSASSTNFGCFLFCFFLICYAHASNEGFYVCVRLIDLAHEQTCL